MTNQDLAARIAKLAEEARRQLDESRVAVAIAVVEDTFGMMERAWKAERLLREAAESPQRDTVMVRADGTCWNPKMEALRAEALAIVEGREP